MPIERLTLEKTRRDRMTAVLGLDGYKGTPEHINNDAVIPVYVLGGQIECDLQPFAVVESNGSEDWGGSAYKLFCLWGPGPYTPVNLFGAPYWFGNDPKVYARLTWLRLNANLTAAGRATAVAANARIVCYFSFRNGANESIVAEWGWSPQAWAGIGFQGRGNLYEVNRHDPEPTGRHDDRALFQPRPPKDGFLLRSTINSAQGAYSGCSWWLEFWYDDGAGGVVPVGASASVRAVMEFYRLP